MKFRPCIDIHNGQVKQIVGGTLKDQGDQAEENFVSGQDAAFYGNMYREMGIRGGHVILLNPVTSPSYQATRQQALEALQAYPGGMQAGGGMTPENAPEFLDAGASHVIVTSYVFRDGKVSWDRLEKMRQAVGREHLVLDVSCRKKQGTYFIVTDRWQKFTEVPVTVEVLKELSGYCDEFLIHGVDSEGRSSGIETELVKILAQSQARPMTYAGGVGSFEDLEILRDLGQNRIDVTVGSALDLFGGSMKFHDVIEFCKFTEKSGK